MENFSEENVNKNVIFFERIKNVCTDFFVVASNIFIYGKFLEYKIVLRAAGNIYKSQLLSVTEFFKIK